VSFALEREQTLGIVGESGSALVHDHRLGELQLVGASRRALRRVHGDAIRFVFQGPSTSRNPLLTLERQITESLEAHRGMTRRTARTRALELLSAVGIPDPESRLDAYPHQLSGGQRQAEAYTRTLMAAIPPERPRAALEA